MGDMEFLQQRFCFFYFRLLAEILACLQERHQVIPNGHLSEYGGFLRQVADPELVALVDGHPGNGTPVYGHIALIRLDDADDHIEGGRLAGPVRSQKTDDGALLDFYIHMIDDGAAAVALDQIMSFYLHLLSLISNGLPAYSGRPAIGVA